MMSLPFFKRSILTFKQPIRRSSGRRTPTFRIDPIQQLEERAVPATLTWEGDVGANWTSGTALVNTNWTDGVDQVLPNSGDTLVFPAGAGNLANVNDTTSGNVYILQFTGAGYAITGNSIALNGSATPMISDVLGGNALNVNLSLTAPSTISATAGTLALGGATLDNGGFLLTVSGAGNTSIANVVSNTGGLTKTGAGTLTLSGLNTYTGDTIISQGTVSASAIDIGGGSSNLGNSVNAVVLGDATNKGVLSYTGNTAAFTRGFTINAGGGEIDVTASGQVLTLQTGGILLNGPVTIGGGGDTINTSTITGAGSLTKKDAGMLTQSSGTSSFGGGVNLTGGTLKINTNSTPTTGTVTSGPLGTGTLTITGGTLKMQNDLSIANSVAFTGPGIINYDWSGTTPIWTGSISFSGTPTINILTNSAAASTFNGTVTFNSDLVVTGSVATNGFVIGGTIDLGGVSRTITSNATGSTTAVNIVGSVNGSSSTPLVLAGSGNAAVGSASGTGAIQVNSTTGGTFTFASGTASFAGGVSLVSGNMTLSNSSNPTTGTVTAGPLGTGTFSLSGGTLTMTGDRTLANALAFSGTGTITYIWSGTTPTWNGPITVTGSPTISGTTTSGASATFNGLLTLNGDLTVTGALPSGGINLSGGFALGGATRTITINNSGTGVVSLAGSLGSTAVNPLIIAGSSSKVTLNNLTGAGALQLNSTTGAVYTINSTTNSFAGGVVVASGNLTLSSNTTPTTGTVTSGPVGTGALTINGGATLTMSGNRTIANNLAFVGPGTINYIWSGTTPIWNGTVAVSGAPTINATTTSGANSTFNGLMTLNSDVTFTGALTGGGLDFLGGFAAAGGSRILTIATTGTAATNITTALSGSATINATGTAAVNLSGVLSGSAATPLIFTGSNTLVSVGLVSGTGAMQVNNGPSGVVSMATAASGSTFSGGVTLTSGILSIRNNSTGSPTVTSGPLGTGTLTLNGGTLRVQGGDAVIANTVNITGSSTFTNSGQTTTLSGPITVTGSPTLTINGANGATNTISGTVALNSDFTLINNYTANSTNISAPFTGPTANFTVKGPGTTNLTSATANTFNSVTVGDNSPTGALGGVLTANSQNALSTANYTINYGASLSTVTAAFNPTNNITVNNGGLLILRGGTTPTGVVSYNSGSRAATTNGNTTLTAGTTGIFPTAGALFFNNVGSGIQVNGSYPTLTGTLAFGGNLGGNFTVLGSTNFGATSNRTIAFNATGTSLSQFSGGVTLQSNLTIAGVGSTGLTGLQPTSATGNLGAITESGGARTVTIALAPTGIATLTRSTAGWTGGTFVNRGILAIDGANVTQVMAGSGGITLNGGTIRNSNAANNNTSWSDAISVGANGGAIESFSTNNYQDVTFTGALTGSGALTLRYGGNTANNANTSSVLLAPTSPSIYSGTITLATTNGNGRVQFNANSLAGVAANGVIVGGGVAFGVNALATLTGNLAKFSTTVDSILALDNLPSDSLDLSSGGLNRDIRIGNRNDITYSGTLTPFGTSYKFTPGGIKTITLGTANQLTDTAGPTARNLDVRAGAVAPGAIGVAKGTLAITAAQNYSGATTVSGTVLNSLMNGGVTGTTLTTTASLGSTTGITLDYGSIFTLTGGTTGGANVPIIVRGGSTLNVNAANALNSSGLLTLGGTNFGGGTYASTTGSNQSLVSLTLGAGVSTINAVSTSVLTLSGSAATVYNRNAGGVVSFSTLQPSFTNAPSSATATSTGVDGDGILVGAFSGTTDFIKAAAGTIAAPAFTTTGAENFSNWGTVGFGGNLFNAATVATGTIANGTTVNSFKFGTSGQSIVYGAAANLLTVKSGMMLYTNAALAASIGTSLVPGQITSGTNELIVGMTAGGTLTLNSLVAKNGANNIVLTKGGGSGGTLILANTSNNISDVYVNSGALQVSGGVGSLGVGGTLHIYGGIFRDATPTGAAYSQNVVVGPQGGTFGRLVNNATTTFNGAVTLNGEFQLFPDTSNNNLTVTFANAISGDGTLYFNSAGSNLRNVIVLQGANGSWTGGARFNALQNLRLENTTAAGTGPIRSLTTDNRTAVTFNTPGAVTVANDIVNVGNLVSWLTGASDTTTLTGKLFSTAGLSIQGNVSGNNTSELVLAGPTSIAGAPTSYNWSSTPTTTIQNFVNGQGGITAGVTDRVGTAQITTAANGMTSSLLLDMPGGTFATQGAAGYVRFSGANSFIPGAVGTGYLAALRKASSGNDGLFGYLLTGTTGGTTYAIPEGKSFVIGSLGTGTQQFGTLGVASDNVAAESATLLGGAKAAAGQTLTGFGGGDINIHANAAADNQSLNLFARAADDTLTLGSSTAAENIVFTPTYGDSGAGTATTLMQKRIGTTALNKTGAGTLNVRGVNYTNTDGTDARGGFTWNVNAGTLRYNNVDSGAAFAGFNVNSGGTLGGSGAIIGNVVVASGATLAPGNSIGVLGVNGSLQLSGLSDFEVTGGSSSADQVNGVTTLTYGGTLKITGSGFLAGDSWDLFNAANPTGTFANNAVFGTAGDGTNLPTLTGGLTWQFNYATGVLSIVQSVAAPTVTSLVPVIGPTTGGTLVAINGSNFVSISSVTFGSAVILPASFISSNATQITLLSPSNLGVPGTVDVIVTNPGGSGTLTGSNDFTYAKPAIASVVVNGGPGVVLGGSSWSLTGQNSVVKQILVTFNQAVSLASDAFTVTPVPVSVNPGPGVVLVNGGASPSSAAVTASIAATLSPSSYLLNFSGPGTHAGGVINSGVYDLTTIASKVSANGETMTGNQVTTFFAMFGNIQANNLYAGSTFTTPIPPGYSSGDGLTNAFVDPGSLFQFSDAFGSNAASPVGPPAYNIIFDSNLDGFIDPGDLFAFSDSFGIDWDF